MSRRSPRIRARFVATVQIGGVDHTLICRSRNISREGCFLETSESIAPGASVSLAVMDNARGEAVSVAGVITRVINGPERGVGVLLIAPGDDWQDLVLRSQAAEAAGRERSGPRLRVVVVSREDNRRGALALYVSSGWDIRFATDAYGAQEALLGPGLDAVICEHEVDDPQWRTILEVARTQQPTARRLVRCRKRGAGFPPSGPNELVHRFVDFDSGMDALQDALTAELGLVDGTTKDLLDEVLGRCSEPRAIVAFDLDSTLLNNAPRQSAILREYGEELNIEILANSKASHWNSWDVGEAMRNAGLAEDLVKVHREPFKEYWRERFFTSEYCVLDEMIPGANKFVQSVLAKSGRVYYLTGRHEEMRRGTVTCLERLGFPVPNDATVHLLMKPTLAEDDDEYKSATYSQLAKEGTVVAAFDNEPTHINGYRKAFPDALSIHLDTDHSGRDVELHPGIVSIPNFGPTDA